MKTEFTLTKRQSIAYEEINNPKNRYIMYGGAKGGAKSYFFCFWAYTWANYLCKLFELQPSQYPIPLGFLGRKQGTDFKKTTLETWKKIIPHEAYEIKAHEGEIHLFNGTCKLFYGGLDSRETINKFNSSELAFFALDQAEEVDREEVAVLRGALRLTHKGIKPPYKELYTSNPADCWLKSDFVDQRQEGYVFIPALPKDNPHLPSDYERTLEEAFKYNLPLLRAYRDGDWHGLKDTNSLFSAEMIEALRKVNVHWPDTKKLVSCDPATSFDECVFKAFENRKEIDQLILSQVGDEMKVAAELVAFMTKHDIYDLVIDEIGLGGGIASRVQQIQPSWNVLRFNSAETADSFGEVRIFNKRAEAYWKASQEIQDKRVGYIEDEETRRQLLATKFEVRNGKIKIIDKDKIKKAIGRSPDRADSWVMGIWAHDHVQPWKPKRVDKYAIEVESDLYEFNPATV